MHNACACSRNQLWACHVQALLMAPYALCKRLRKRGSPRKRRLARPMLRDQLPAAAVEDMELAEFCAANAVLVPGSQASPSKSIRSKIRNGRRAPNRDERMAAYCCRNSISVPTPPLPASLPDQNCVGPECLALMKFLLAMGIAKLIGPFGLGLCKWCFPSSLKPRVISS